MDDIVTVQDDGGPAEPVPIDELFAFAREVKGFMPEDEGIALYAAARGVGAALGPWMEVGAWCGKSTVYLGAAAQSVNAVLFSLDHHRGSEENQAGWEHHDPSVVDPASGRIDTLPLWRATISRARLEQCVVGVVGDSATVARCWGRPLAFCFIDGGHGSKPAWDDYLGWSPHVAMGGMLAIHDVFPNPADGGRPPYEIYCAALASGLFQEESMCGSLRILRRI
ncbi:MAG: class I SAM-dependent methyltransferase [Actinobacteria bacterium]|nr:class I SAM-dependent methyltransferase [Actinomycetota bacterium]